MSAVRLETTGSGMYEKVPILVHTVQQLTAAIRNIDSPATMFLFSYTDT